MRSDLPFEIPEEWECVSLRSVAEKIGSGATPKGGESSYLNHRDNYALVRSQNVFDRFFSDKKIAFITDEQASKLQGVMLREDDVLLNITGDGVTFGRSCIVPKHILPACVNQHVSIIRVVKGILDPHYLVSFLTHPSIKIYIESFNAGGSRRAITKGHIESFAIPLPPYDEQRAIAHVLQCIDNKILLNLRRIDSLDSFTQSLYRSWFVDFEPVKFLSGDLPVDLSANIAAQFPSSYVDSDIGEIPSGWDVVAVGSFAKVVKSSVNPLDAENECFEHYSIPSFDDGEIPSVEMGSSILSQKYSINSELILVSKLNPATPRVWIPSGDTRYRQICSTEFMPCQISDSVGRSYAYCLFRSAPVLEAMTSLATGTSNSHQRVRPDEFLGIKCTIPPLPLLHIFRDVANPVIERCLLLRSECIKLTELRDVILPSLVSGEIRFPDAEKMLEEVGV